MRWLAVLFVLSLAPACTTKSDTPEAEQADKKAKKSQSADKSATQKKGGDKATAQKKGTQQKGATQKGAAQKGAAQKGKPGEKKPPVIYGAAGPVYGELKLEEKEVGEKKRTAAQLALTAGDKAQTVRLGAIAGTCTESTELAKVSEAVTALWTVDCDTEQGKASVAIAQDGESLLIARAAAGTTEYKQIRKFQLAKGAELSRKQ